MKTARLTYAEPDDHWTKKLVINAVEKLSGRDKLEKLYGQVLEQLDDSRSIWSLMLEKLRVNLHFVQDRQSAIPSQGPLVFISNHPFGVVDGIVLCHLVSQYRPDFKILVNQALCKDETINPFLLPIDFSETKTAVRTNIQTKNEALNKLNANSAIAIFPSGGVATAQGLNPKARELEWKRFVAKLIRQSGATVVPVYFFGQNSLLFQYVSHLHTDVRLGLLLNEVRNKIGRAIHLSVGQPITAADYGQYKTTDEMLAFLKNSVFGLQR